MYMEKNENCEARGCLPHITNVHEGVEHSLNMTDAALSIAKTIQERVFGVAKEENNIPPRNSLVDSLDVLNGKLEELCSLLEKLAAVI